MTKLERAIPRECNCSVGTENPHASHHSGCASRGFGVEPSVAGAGCRVERFSFWCHVCECYHKGRAQ